MSKLTFTGSDANNADHYRIDCLCGSYLGQLGHIRMDMTTGARKVGCPICDRKTTIVGTNIHVEEARPDELVGVEVMPREEFKKEFEHQKKLWKEGKS